MGNIYGEQYVFTDPDIRAVQATVMPKDAVLDNEYYNKLKIHTAVTVPEGSGENKAQEWQKIAMCHNDKVELAVDNNWINATPLDVNPDSVVGEYEDIAGGFVLFHTQQDKLRGKIDTEKVIQITQSSKQAGDKEAFTYGDVLSFKSATVDNAGHITNINNQRFILPEIYDSPLPEKEWKTQAETDKLNEQRNPMSAKVVAPAVIYLQKEVAQLKEEVQGIQTATPGDGDPTVPNEDLGLLTRVSTLENEVTDIENAESHINRIANLENEVGITSNANKPGLEFKTNEVLHLRPIENDATITYLTTGTKATVLNSYTNEEIPIPEDTTKTYLKDTNKAVGMHSLASGKGTFAIGDYSNASGFATAALDNSAHAEGASLVVNSNAANNVFKLSANTPITLNANTLTYSFENLSSILNNFPTDSDITLDTKIQYLKNCVLGVPVHTTDKGDFYVKLFLQDGSIKKSGTNNIANTIQFVSGNLELPSDITTEILKNSQEPFVYLHCGSACGPRSHTENYGTIASGEDAHAEGQFSCAKNQGAHAEGGFTTASGVYSHTEGKLSKASGKQSHAEGFDTTASGENSHAEGIKTVASKEGAHAEGKNSTASGNYSHAEGEGTAASGAGAHTEGQNTNANKKGSHAEGGGTTASGDYAHAEGCSTGTDASETSKGSVASGKGSHAEGGGTTASGNYSHAEGQNTTANKTASHAAGFQTQTNCDYQTVVGTFNDYDSAKQGYFIVGGGTSTAPKNLFRVGNNNKIYGVSTSIEGGADYAEYFEWEDQNLNNEDRIGYFVTFGEEDKIKIGNSDEILGVISGTAAIIANGQEDGWVSKYEKDIYGRDIYEDYIDPNGLLRRVSKLNPAYDPQREYIPRSQRSEWAVVGMLGRLIVRDDGSCVVGKRCTSNEKGIATYSSTGYRVLKRLDESHIQILFK